tara:strand:- start:8187 stop:8663 length:477 start_codon:yes stop_codon:yes gene_type:complete
MISVELLIKHMQWANKEIYTEISKLDDEVLEYYVIDPEWTVKKIMIHIVGAAYLFSQRLDGKPFSKFELKNTEGPELIKELIEELEKIDESFLKHVEREDVDITYMTSKGERTSKVSMIISTMINHATEHRTQIVAALDKNNVRTINLDNYSPWSLPG